MAEHKFSDTLIIINTGNPITTAGAITRLTGIAQGITDVTRIGDKVTGLSLEVRFMIEPAFVTTDARIYQLRMIIFIWKDETVPTAADIIQSNIVTNQMISPLDHDRKVKRKILHDQVYYGMNNTGTTTISTYQPYTNQKIYIPLMNIKNNRNVVNFTDNATPPNAINHIWILLLCPVGATAEWNTTIYTRYNYADV